MSITGEPEGEPQKVIRPQTNASSRLRCVLRTVAAGRRGRWGWRWRTCLRACTPRSASWRLCATLRRRAVASTSTSPSSTPRLPSLRPPRLSLPPPLLRAPWWPAATECARNGAGGDAGQPRRRALRHRRVPRRAHRAVAGPAGQRAPEHRAVSGEPAGPRLTSLRTHPVSCSALSRTARSRCHLGLRRRRLRGRRHPFVRAVSRLGTRRPGGRGPCRCSR